MGLFWWFRAQAWRRAGYVPTVSRSLAPSTKEALGYEWVFVTFRVRVRVRVGL